MEKQTRFNKEISKYAGTMVLDEGDLEGYLITKEGKLIHKNLRIGRSNNALREGSFCNFWSNKSKSNFKKRLLKQVENKNG